MVSVIIPTYNRAQTIERAARSVLDQSYGDLELIIIDDGSIDSTKAVIENINDVRIRYYYQENSGACSARNKGIDLARGKYIAFQDSDDFWLPQKLERQIQVLEENHADILFCQLRRCNEEDGTTVIPEMKSSGFILRHDLMVGISTQTLFMRRQVAEQVKFDKSAPRFQDLEWILRASKDFSIYGMKEVLVDYYFSDDSISKSSKKLMEGISLIYRKNPHLEETPEIQKVLRDFLIYEGIIQFKQGNSEYINYLKLGYSLSNQFLDKLKLLIVRVGIFRQLYYLRHLMDNSEQHEQTFIQ